MKKFRTGKPSPAFVVAVFALLIAMSGTGYAVTQLPPNSVGTEQLKEQAVTTKKIAPNAVTGAKVAGNTLKGGDIKESTLGTVPTAINAASATDATNATNAAHATNATNATNAGNADRLDGLDSADLLRSNGKAQDADALDGINSAGFVQGTGKTYVGRVVLPTSNSFPNDIVLVIPGFATLRTLNCQAGGANASLVSFDQARGTFSGWRSTGADNPDYASSPGLSSWSSNFQLTERTTWHFSVGTGASSEAALIDLHTQVSGSNCIYSAVAQVWGR